VLMFKIHLPKMFVTIYEFIGVVKSSNGFHLCAFLWLPLKGDSAVFSLVNVSGLENHPKGERFINTGAKGNLRIKLDY
jgi:hypothetical protein